MKGFGRKWWHWAIAGFLLLSIIGAITGGGEDENGNSSTAAQTTTETTSRPTEKPAKKKPQKPKTPEQRLKEALADAVPIGGGEIKIVHVEYGAALIVEVETPEGGFEGPSTRDLDDSAAGVFRAVYGVARYPATKQTMVMFQGGLVDTATGKELPEAVTGTYVMKGGMAKQIDWSDDDAIYSVIDWSNYRVFAHPALKSD